MKALDEIRRAMEVLPDSMSGILAYHKAYCSSWLKVMKKYDESVEMAFSCVEILSFNIV